MSLSEIFDIIQNPDFKYILKSKLTIKEGNTIPEVAKAFSEIIDMSEDDIIKAWSNQEYLKSLIKDYWFIDNSILNRNILYPLEGYLYPDTYYVTDENPTLEGITKLALDMMDKKLTPYKDKMKEIQVALRSLQLRKKERNYFNRCSRGNVCLWFLYHG